jgi:hypothetical protein
VVVMDAARKQAQEWKILKRRFERDVNFPKLNNQKQTGLVGFGNKLFGISEYKNQARSSPRYAKSG